MDNVTVLTICPECGRPTTGPFEGVVVTSEHTGQFVPIESLEIRDDLIAALRQMVWRLECGQEIPTVLRDRFGMLAIEHEKLMQADR